MLRPMIRLALPVFLLLGGAHAASLTLAPGQTGRLGAATVTLLRVPSLRCAGVGSPLHRCGRIEGWYARCARAELQGD